MDNAVYIIFSATPTWMGRLIRLATRHGYNHVSLSLSGDFRRIYSFARYYQDVPLYGGLVEESLLRYRTLARCARVKICRLPVEEPWLTNLHSFLERMWNERAEYIYNTPAALASLAGRRPEVPRAYTCATFIQEVLVRCRARGAEEARCPTIQSLEELLAPYVVYEGSVLPFTGCRDWGEDRYPVQISTRRAVYVTVRHFGRLAKRALL